MMAAATPLVLERGIIALLAGAIMVVLDFFIVMVTLPTIQADLRASNADLQWVVTGYGMANAAGLITGGRLGDMYGRHRMYVLGLALFSATSVICAFAPSSTALILARIAQGLAGALVLPQVLAILSNTFSGDQRVKVFGIYAACLGFAGVTGQLLGGMLVELNIAGLGWRSCFLINLPIGIAAIWISLTVPEDRPRGGQTLDLVGAALVAALMALLIVPLTFGREQSWPAWSYQALIGAACIAILLVAHQRRSARIGAQPLLPPELFRLSWFKRGMVAVLAFYGGIASFYFVLALFLQHGLGLSPYKSGLVFAVLGVAFVIGSFAVKPLAQRWGPKALAVGVATLGAGHLTMLGSLMLQSESMRWVGLFASLVVQGFGVGLTLGPLLSRVLSGIPAAMAGVASGVQTTVQQVGNAVGVAMIGLVYYQAPAGTGYTFSLIYLLVLIVVLLALLGPMSSPGGAGSK